MKKLVFVVALLMSTHVFAKGGVDDNKICDVDPKGESNFIALGVDSTLDLKDTVEVNLTLSQLKCLNGKVENLAINKSWEKLNVYEKKTGDTSEASYSVRPNKIEKTTGEKMVKYKLTFQKKFLNQSQLLNLTLGSHLKNDFLFNFVLDLNNASASGYSAEINDVSNVISARGVLTVIAGYVIGVMFL